MTTRGERLRSYLMDRTGGRHGWQADLVRRSGVKRQTITKWTTPTFDGYPDLETLSVVAAALGVRTWEVVAALDGDADATLDEQTRELVRSEVEAAVSARLGPRQGPHG